MLSNKQKAYLSQLARQAFDRLRADATRAGRVHPADHALAGWPLDAALWDAEEFRHTEVAKAVSKNGLRCCGQADYKRVEAHFLNLLGQPQRAERALARDAGNDLRVAEYKITNLLAQMRRTMSYADAISRRMFRGQPITECSPGQLWKIYYALNKERQKSGERRAESGERTKQKQEVNP